MANNVINVDFLARNRSKLPIAPAVEEVEMTVAPDHRSDPIKSLEDIEKMSQYFVANSKYRDNMLFIVGINFGLRISDLLELRFTHLIDDTFSFRHSFEVLEKKTRNTRKVKKNRRITINDAVMDAVMLYLENTPGVTLSDYMFRSESNNGKNDNKPIHRNVAEQILKSAAAKVGLNIHVATHTLRKTFGYHQMLMGNNDPRKLLLLQKIFGHSTSAQTLDYIGITSEEIEEAYLNLNLGYKKNKVIKEVEITA